MRHLPIIFLLAAGCTDIAGPNIIEPLTITLHAEKNADRERETRKQLIALHNKYDLEKWVFTRDIIIKSGAIAHSHPVLTLNTRHNGNEAHLLATYLHEQFHWYTLENETATNSAIKSLKAMFKDVPVGRPEGAKNLDSTYLHLLVCMLEYDALRDLIGEDAARELIQSKTYYTWIYTRILDPETRIREVMETHSITLP